MTETNRTCGCVCLGHGECIPVNECVCFSRFEVTPAFVHRQHPSLPTNHTTRAATAPCASAQCRTLGPMRPLQPTWPIKRQSAPTVVCATPRLAYASATKTSRGLPASEVSPCYKRALSEGCCLRAHNRHANVYRGLPQRLQWPWHLPKHEVPCAHSQSRRWPACAAVSAATTCNLQALSYVVCMLTPAPLPTHPHPGMTTTGTPRKFMVVSVTLTIKAMTALGVSLVVCRQAVEHGRTKQCLLMPRPALRLHRRMPIW